MSQGDLWRQKYHYHLRSKEKLNVTHYEKFNFDFINKS